MKRQQKPKRQNNAKNKGLKPAALKPDNEEAPLFPMRLNKYMAHRGMATRRGADELIEKGQVLINGKRAVLGSKVESGDKVSLTRAVKPKEYVYLAYHKPAGVVTHSPQFGEEDIAKVLKKAGVPKDVAPLGRLDKASRGLILLTNDGRLTDRLLNPKFEHEKEYVVKTREELRSNFKQKMEAGVDIEGYVTRPTKVEIRGPKEFAVTLTEGKKHQIRRMVSALHNDVADLRRTRVMNIRLGNLPLGELRHLTDTELSALLKSLGL
jgi:23S rRNA pseudouridine2604 synthase